MWKPKKQAAQAVHTPEPEQQRLQRLAALRWMVGKSIELGPTYFRGFVDTEKAARDAHAELERLDINALLACFRGLDGKPVYSIVVCGAAPVERMVQTLLPHNQVLTEAYKRHLTENGLTSAIVTRALQTGAAQPIAKGPRRPTDMRSLLARAGVPVGNPNNVVPLHPRR